MKQTESYLEKIEDQGIFSGPVPDEGIAAFEEFFGQRLPEIYKQFISKYGSISTRSEFNIFGLGVNKAKPPSLYWAGNMIRLSCPGTPGRLLPVAPTDENRFACYYAKEGEINDDSPILAWELGKPLERQRFATVAHSFSEFLEASAFELYVMEQAIKIYSEHVFAKAEKSRSARGSGRKLSRNTDWRPYRFCSQDIVLGITVVKHQKGENCLLVDAFLPIDLPPFEKGGSLLFLTTYLLAEAYRCGGTMEIRFTKNVDGGQVPRKIQALAEGLGVPIKGQSLAERRLSPDDSRRLLLALTGFSDPVTQQIHKSGMNPEAVCYVVQHGIWSKAEAESLLLGYDHADRIFAGGTSPKSRIAYQLDAIHARTAILMGHLDRGLSWREHGIGKGQAIELEDDTRLVETAFDATTYARVYNVSPAPDEAETKFSIPWLENVNITHSELPFGQSFMVLVRARSASSLVRSFASDIKQAVQVKKKRNLPVFILVPQDFLAANLTGHRRAWIQQSSEKGIGILACSENVNELGNEAFRRFKASRMARK